MNNLQRSHLVCGLLIGIVLRSEPALARGASLPTSTPAAARGAGPARIDPRVRSELAALEPHATLPVWVVFGDKGRHEAEKSSLPRTLVSERSLQRRLKVRSTATLLDAADLPLEERYVQQIAARVTRVRQRSRWFNRVSVEATAEEIASIAALPFVRSVEPLARFHRAPDAQLDAIEPEDQETSPRGDSPTNDSERPGEQVPEALNYGLSLGQLQRIGVTTMHSQGFTGQGVLVGHFDNGYRLLSHESLLPVDIVAGYDFVDHDPDPAPPLGSPSNYGAHGINTLSVIAGYAPGQLVGAAYGASYVLARTENDASETPVEEDNWVAAIEWADSLGIDVATTSLGYLTYDAPFTSWTWQDMNGDTTVITRAADRAAALGIVVVNSAGNNGFDPTHNTLNAPADGDSVVAIGAVDSFGTRASFSSIGPTTDIPARIKPDVMAQGVAVYRAGTLSTTSYGRSNGTSFSGPLAAGVAALLVQAHPAATAQQIADAMRNTASQHTTPDNLNGWGIVNAAAASAALNASDVAADVAPARRRLEIVPNPFNPSAVIRYELPEPAGIAITVVDARGRLVRSLRAGPEPAGPGVMAWDGRDAGGHELPSGTYFVRLVATPEHDVPWTVRTKAVLLR